MCIRDRYFILTKFHFTNFNMTGALGFFQHFFCNSTFKANKYSDNENTSIGIQEPQDKPPLLSNNTAVINTVLMRYHYFRAILRLNDGVALVAKERAKRLIALLKQQYNF